MKFISTQALVSRLRTAFPDRELIMRSHGEVRFIRLSSRVQIGALCLASSLGLAWIGTMSVVAALNISASNEQAALLAREAKVTSAESRVAEYRAGVASKTADLIRRQQFIEQMVDAHITDMPDDGAAQPAAVGADQEAQKPAVKVSAALPGERALDQIEAEQLAFVERLTRYADRRAETAVASIRKLGLSPTAMMAGSTKMAMGGPLLKLATSADGSLDPRFRQLGMSLARMDALENGLASIPQVSPAHVAYVSSSFGYRADPFTGAAAFHAGLDFPGPKGSAIYAAAKGRVSFVGQKQGYGNCIEITHGNGLMTRYAHLSRFSARVGQDVDAGTVIAAMGSTGRSTGSHLHFEVRLNDRPMNPRPFLEAAAHVSAKQG